MNKREENSPEKLDGGQYGSPPPTTLLSLDVCTYRRSNTAGPLVPSILHSSLLQISTVANKKGK